MKLKNLIALSVVLGSQVACVFAAAPKNGGAQAAQSSFQVSDKTEVPDGSLKPGNYTIRVVDHLADRMVVEIQGANGGAKQIFLAVPSKSSAPNGPVTFTGSKGDQALRGFSFSDGNVDFVYPKNDAVALAKANGVTVVAVDPASEGMPAAHGLSPEDRRMVTLWMLTPTPVGPGDAKPGIQAAKYQAPPAADTSLRAEAKAPAAPPAAARPPVVRRLPKTGSMLPLTGLFCLGFLGLGAGLTFNRLRTGVR